MKERVILHCDLNNYFASVECLSHPEWKEVPMAVCGSVEARHGIVLAKNELAKKAGIQTAMPVWEAKRLCPDLTIAPPHYDLYQQYSARVQWVYAQFTDRVEAFGIDECWLDVTGSRLLFGAGEQMAVSIKELVKRQLGLTLSVGVSFCKVMAKLGSDMKKPDAVTVINREDLPHKVWPLPVGELFGVGRRTRAALAQMGIFTLGQLAGTNPDVLQHRMGKMGVQLWQFANGLEYAPVAKIGDKIPPKSVSRSTTLPYDLETSQQVRRVLVGLAEEVSAELRKEKANAGVVKLLLRDSSLQDMGKQIKLTAPTRLVTQLVDSAMALFPALWNGRPLRAVGIGAEALVPEHLGVQTDLFHDPHKGERLERLETRVGEIRYAFGNGAVVRASQMNVKSTRLGSSFGHLRI